MRESWTRPQGEETGQLSHLGEHLLVWKLDDNPTKSVELVEKSRVAGKERGKVDIEVLPAHPLYSCLQILSVCSLRLKQLFMGH